MLEIELATIRNILVRKNNIGIRIDKTDFCQSADNHLASHIVLIDKVNGTKFVKFYASIVFGNDAGVGSSVTSNTTGVESTEGKLRTRLTNSLCGNYADSFAELNHTRCSKVASVTLHADTTLALASEHRADGDGLDG